MARADLILKLAEAAVLGDLTRARAVIEALAAEERANRHTVLAEDLSAVLARSTKSAPPRPVPSTGRGHGGLYEVEPKRRLGDIVLPETVREELVLLVEEQHRAEMLRAFNIEPRHRVLLVGPPGNGKTTCAEAIAAELSVPLLVLRYEAVITSFLGETSANVAAVLDDVRTRHCVLFLDEFDTLAKERGDEHDTGEIKRVVSALLLQLDRLPSHVVLCAATNHSELLDRAVWRRFELRLELPAPTRAERAVFLSLLADRMGMTLGKAPRTLADKLKDASYAELEEFVLEMRRRELLAGVASEGSAAIADGMIRSWARRASPPTEIG